MKSWFRIGPDQGNEQDGPQPPERYSSADPTVRFLDPFTVLALTAEGRICEGSRFSGARFLRPFTPLALTRKGRLCEGGRFSDVRFLHSFTVSACEGSRFSGARRFRALPLAPTPLLPRQPGLKSGTNLSEIRQFPDISNRFCLKNRSYRKQTTKPCLTGSRIARCVTGSLHDSRTLFVPAVASAASASASLLENVRQSGRV